MQDTQQIQQIVFEVLHSLVRRRDEDGVEVRLESNLFEDLDLDSLEVAELSVALEDDLGSDPFSDGAVPRTVAEVIAFYG